MFNCDPPILKNAVPWGRARRPPSLWLLPAARTCEGLAPVSLLAIKLIVTPLVVLLASLASRRWGDVVAGWLVGLPLTSAPVSVFLAIEQGPLFAAQAAMGSIARRRVASRILSRLCGAGGVGRDGSVRGRDGGLRPPRRPRCSQPASPPPSVRRCVRGAGSCPLALAAPPIAHLGQHRRVVGPADARGGDDGVGRRAHIGGSHPWPGASGAAASFPSLAPPSPLSHSGNRARRPDRGFARDGDRALWLRGVLHHRRRRLLRMSLLTAFALATAGGLIIQGARSRCCAGRRKWKTRPRGDRPRLLFAEAD